MTADTLPSAAPAALATYERLAPFYDAFSAGYDHPTWLVRLVDVARAHGLRGTRALDVACGTGKSAEPLVDLGFDVRAYDLSPGMAAVAGKRLAGRAEVVVGDMRGGPDLGPADLVTCLDDAVNYLHTADDVRAAFSSARRALAPGGVYVFDVNTQRTYETAFTATDAFVSGGLRFRWRGLGCQGGLWRAAVDVRRGRAILATATHVQRHWRAGRLTALLGEAGLRPVALLGQTTGAVLHARADERAHTKLVVVARARGGAA